MYDSDVTQEEWGLIETYFQPTDKRGAVPKHDKRAIVNAIFYLNKTGCQWRMLPKEYGKWEKGSAYWDRWSANGLWETINTALREAVREKAGRKRWPTAAIIDSQSVKTVQKGGSAVLMRASRSKGANGISR